jgi:hypothetical protein
MRLRKVLLSMPESAGRSTLPGRPILLSALPRGLRLQDSGGVEASGFGLRASGFGLRASGFGLRASGFGLDRNSRYVPQRSLALQITTVSWYSPNTLRIASEISPTVA